jgi:hypothetical protein
LQAGIAGIIASHGATVLMRLISSGRFWQGGVSFAHASAANIR